MAVLAKAVGVILCFRAVGAAAAIAVLYFCANLAAAVIAVLCFRAVGAAAVGQAESDGEGVQGHGLCSHPGVLREERPGVAWQG